jgi:hypothetical protein
VLPNSKLNLIGLRGLYSPGDRVELNCLSDFSRPAAALSWFINGRRVVSSGGSCSGRRPPLTGDNHRHAAAAAPALRMRAGDASLEACKSKLAAAANDDDDDAAAERVD